MLAFNQDLYDLLKYLHIVAAVVWVGSGLFVQYYASRLRRAQDPARLGAFAKDIEAAGKQVFAPASITVLVMGLLMVWYSDALGFSETWILIGIAGFIATFITGNFFLGPTAGKIGAASRRRGAGIGERAGADPPDPGGLPDRPGRPAAGDPGDGVQTRRVEPRTQRRRAPSIRGR